MRRRTRSTFTSGALAPEMKASCARPAAPASSACRPRAAQCEYQRRSSPSTTRITSSLRHTMWAQHIANVNELPPDDHKFLNGGDIAASTYSGQVLMMPFQRVIPGWAARKNWLAKVSFRQPQPEIAAQLKTTDALGGVGEQADGAGFVLRSGFSTSMTSGLQPRRAASARSRSVDQVRPPSAP